MTIGEALGARIRDVTTTETPIRTRLRFKGGSAAVPRALEIIDAYVAGKLLEHNATPVPTSNGAQIVRQAQFALTRFASPDNLFVSLSENHHTKEPGGRRFTSTLSVAPDGVVDLQLEVARRMTSARPSLAMPRVIRDLARDPDVGLVEFTNETEVLCAPRFADPGDRWFQQNLFAPERSLAIIACGYPLALSDAAMNDLASRVCGLAHVVAIRDREISFEITNTYGKEWSVFQSALRVYGPRLDFSDDPRRVSRLFFEKDFGPQAPGDALRRVLDDLVWLAGTLVQSELLDEAMPSLESAIRRVARAVVDEKPAPAAATAASETELEVVAERDDRIAELQAEIDQLRRANSLLTEEVNFEQEHAASWRATADEQKAKITELLEQAALTTAFAELTPQWAKVIRDLIDVASASSTLEQRLADLEATNATLLAQQSAIEQRLAASPAAGNVPPPEPQNPISLMTYLAAKYPGVFELYGQGERSYKKTDPYEDQSRFLAALDVLGREYYAWKTASGDDLRERKAAFDRRCEELSLKNTPSATPQGYAVNPEDHTVRLSGTHTAPMYELRDHGTSMQERHMLYIGYAWDDRIGRVVIARFDHPEVMSSHT